MPTDKRLVNSALVLFAFGGLALIYGRADLPSDGGGSYSNPSATLDSLATTLAPYYINGGSLCFGLAAVVLLALIWRKPGTAQQA